VGGCCCVVPKTLTMRVGTESELEKKSCIEICRGGWEFFENIG